MAELSVKVGLPPTLQKFAASNEFVRCVVGPVGSGKSTACIAEILRRASEQKPGKDGKRRSRFAIIRNTYGELRDTTRKTFEQWVPQDPRFGNWSEQEFTFTIDIGDLYCEVLFRALDKPEDVKKLLSLELTGAYINEGREIPQSVVEMLTVRVGRYPSSADGGPTWSGIWIDTNPWHPNHWIPKLLRKEPRAIEVFRQPSGRSPQAENLQNLPTDYYKRACIGKDAEWIKVYVDGQDASTAEGSIFGKLVSDLQARGGLDYFEHPTEDVFTSWDLGISDSTAIWFWRIRQFELRDPQDPDKKTIIRAPEFIDHYEANNQPLSHFFKVIDGKPYRYLKHWLPHDARTRSIQTGLSIVEQFANHFGSSPIDIGPPFKLLDGIQAARWLLEQPIRIHPRCTQGIDALREYRYKWDEKDRAFSTTPLHDWASHTADAFRYAATVVLEGELITRKETSVLPKPAAVPMNYSFTLEELFQDHETSLSRRRR